MRFDPNAAKLLKPGQHLLVEGCDGLRLEASASRKSWIYRYKSVAGTMRQTKLGQWPAMPMAAAVSAWQALVDVRAAGQDPKAVNRRKPTTELAGYAVRRLVDDYLDGHIEHNRKPAGVTAARRALTTLLDEERVFASMQAAEVTRSLAFDLLEARKSTPTAATKLRSMLASAWDYALDAGRLGEDSPNWWRQVQRGRLKSKGKIVGGEHQGRARRVLSPAEISQLLAWLPAMHEVGRDATVLYLWTGVRGSEIFSLRPEHLQEERGVLWWVIPKALTKNAHHEFAVDLRVPLFGRALDVVKRRAAAVGKSGALFEDEKGEQYTQKAFSTYVYDLQPYSAKARRMEGRRLTVPVTGWTPHNLRRTARTLLASLKCPKEVAEAMIGHLPEVMDATYNSHSYDAERLLWLKRLAAHLEKLAKHQPPVDGLPARP
ncbi:integrase family protein [Paucibacter sp. R3-3]|uniref:Integrase family protein n=1 Tax=Roseateles agri TaxID=3098619 RepID=A0ABU5DQJ8_9BURK|nr:integrase family protein [Paucibacter sp. R3-3]MDY0747327.1 integrase family protein [Paucibacter sp. R3-3]